MVRIEIFIDSKWIKRYMYVRYGRERGELGFR